MDLVGPFTPDTNSYTYMVVEIDEATRVKRVYGVKNRGEAFSIIKQRKEDITMDAVNMRTIRGDGTDELGRSTKFRETLLNLGIKWKN